MELLETLTQTPSVPGREDRVRDLIQGHVSSAGLFDELRVDAMGSLIGIRRPRPKDGGTIESPTKVMMAAHMDQIGFLVSYISEDGFLRVNPVVWIRSPQPVRSKGSCLRRVGRPARCS